MSLTKLMCWYLCCFSTLQALLKGAGKDGHTTVFLLTDTQIKQESFLEDVDGLLNAGEVANLYAIDEKQDIIEVLRIIAKLFAILSLSLSLSLPPPLLPLSRLCVP